MCEGEKGGKEKKKEQGRYAVVGGVQANKSRLEKTERDETAAACDLYTPGNNVFLHLTLVSPLGSIVGQH